MNTRNMTLDELKVTLHERARVKGIDPTDPEHRFTVWSENGAWCKDAAHILFEGSAATEQEKEFKVSECVRKTGYSRTMVLDARRDQIEIVPPMGVASAFGSR